MTYIVQYMLEPNEPVAVSDWREHCRKIQISNKRPDVKQAIIEKLLTLLSAPFIVLDYWLE